MASQNDLDYVYLKMCKEWSSLSQARRKKVGCLIVKDHQIISDGFNGMPSGFPNECEFKFEGRTLPEVLHAEANAITKLSKSTNSSFGATLYCTLSPCLECAKLIVQAGIKRIIFSEEYETTDFGPICDFLEKAGVLVDTWHPLIEEEDYGINEKV